MALLWISSTAPKLESAFIKMFRNDFVVLFVYMPHTVVLIIEIADKILNYDRSNGSYWTEHFTSRIHNAVQGGSNFESVNEIQHATIQMKAIEQYFSVGLFVTLNKLVLIFTSVDEVPKCDHSNESYWAVLSCGAVYYAVQGGSNFLAWGCRKS